MAEQQNEEYGFDNNINYADGTQEEIQEEVAEEQEEEAPVQPRPQAPQRPRSRPPQKRQQSPVTPQMAVASAAPMPQQAPPQAPQARFVPYEMPKRIGLLDRVTGKPVIEDEDMLRVVMAQLADIKNDLEEIKSYYS